MSRIKGRDGRVVNEDWSQWQTIYTHKHLEFGVVPSFFIMKKRDTERYLRFIPNIFLDQSVFPGKYSVGETYTVEEMSSDEVRDYL